MTLPQDNVPLRVEWDDADKKQIEDVKKIYQYARQKNRTITDINGNVLDAFHPSLKGFIIKQVELKDSEFAVRVLDETGDRRLIWDSDDPQQVAEAIKLFDDYLSRGWRAYSVNHDGTKRRRILGFNQDTLEVLFIEKTNEEIIKNFSEQMQKENSEDLTKTKSETIKKFVASYRDSKLVPRTYPG